MLLERGGAPLVERYWGSADAVTLHDPRSVGKSVTSLAVGVAIGEALLPSVETLVFEHLGDLRPFAHDGAAKAAITVRDLLTMSSALACDDYASSPGNERHMYPERVWARWAVDLPLCEGHQRDPTGLGPFAYCTAGNVLARPVAPARQRVDVAPARAAPAAPAPLRRRLTSRRGRSPRAGVSRPGGGCGSGGGR